jgi:hypothetical protein
VHSSKLATVLSAVLALGTMAPVLADDGSGLDKAVDGSLIVPRLAGMTAGVVVGTPIAVLKQTTRSFVHITSGAADKVGDHTFAPSCVLATFFSFPASLVVGSTKGVISGTKNGINGFGSPFNFDSFSLGNLNEE